MLLLGLIALVYGLKHRTELYAAWVRFYEWLASFWGRRPSHSGPAEPIPIEMQVDSFPPFRTFSDPFKAGNGMSNEQKVRYLYQSLLSWGNEHKVINRSEETPDEYVRRIGNRYADQREPFRLLGSLYSRIAYAKSNIAKNDIDSLENLWSWLSKN